MKPTVQKLFPFALGVLGTLFALIYPVGHAAFCSGVGAGFL